MRSPLLTAPCSTRPTRSASTTIPESSTPSSLQAPPPPPVSTAAAQRRLGSPASAPRSLRPCCEPAKPRRPSSMIRPRRTAETLPSWGAPGWGPEAGRWRLRCRPRLCPVISSRTNGGPVRTAPAHNSCRPAFSRRSRTPDKERRHACTLPLLLPLPLQKARAVTDLVLNAHACSLHPSYGASGGKGETALRQPDFCGVSSQGPHYF